MNPSDISLSGSVDENTLAPFNTDLQSVEHISHALAIAVKGYGKNSQRVADRLPMINQTKLLAGLTSTATEDAIGRCLYHNIMQLIKKLGATLLLVVNNNFDFTLEQERIRSTRESIVVSVKEDELIAARVLSPPNNVKFQNTLDIDSADMLEELEATIPEHSDPVAAEQRRRDIARAISDHQRVLRAEYVALHEEYDESVVLKSEASLRLLQYKHELDDLVTLETFVDNLIIFQHTIATRVTSTLNDGSSVHSAHLTSIQVKLKCKALLHNAEVVDPLLTLHLPGILWLLYTNYVVDSLNYYFDALIEAFSYTMALDEAQNSPDVALARLVGICNDWHMRGLYDRLSQDLLFTCLAVKAVPAAAAFRSYLISETTLYMRRLQSNEVTSNSRTPVFDHVKTLASRFVADKRLQTHPGVPAQLPAPSPAGAPKPNRPFNPYNRRPPAAQPQLENAAAALVPTAGSSTYTPRTDCAGQRFSGEVAVSRHLCHNNLPYMAVARMSGICATCFPDSGTGTPCKMAARHYKGQCTRCNYFGHKVINCLQTHGVDDKPLP